MTRQFSATAFALFLVCAVIPTQHLNAQGQQAPQDQPTFQINSSLVFLDVTVLDKKGHPVVTGLKKEDFTITEEKKPQRIFSFEAPETHTAGARSANPEGNGPLTVIVLDMLNSEFSDFAYIRYTVRKFLMAQPEQLNAPTELMVVGNESLEMLQGYTRSRADLLYALKHLPPVLPYKRMNGAFMWERFGQSIDALQQIALQNKGFPGRKNIVWVGHGGPSINLEVGVLTWQDVDMLKKYVHATANMLVDSRVSLFVIYPGLEVNEASISLSAEDADADIGETDPFAGDITFGVLVDETGGKLFYNRNDLDALMTRSIQLGSNYYTLTYQPQGGVTDGKFRRIRVTLRDPNLHALTKAGYFAPEKGQSTDPRQKAMVDIVEAAESTIPFTGVGVKIERIVRHPDARTASLTVRVSGKNLDWVTGADGHSTARLLVGAASLGYNQAILASRLEKVAIRTQTQDPAKRETTGTELALTLRVPRNTMNVRVVVETDPAGQMGSAAADRKTIDAAPEAPTPQPQLVPKPAEVGKPAQAPS